MQRSFKDRIWGAAEPTGQNTVARMLDVIRTSSSAPALVETGEGARYVLKFSGAGAGAYGLLTEFLATEIARGKRERRGTPTARRTGKRA